MRIFACLLTVLLMSACSVIPPAAWSFDPTQTQPKPALAIADAVALTDRTAQLQLARNDIRTRIANEPDARNRLGLYQSLHRVGMQLSPLERQLGSVAAAR